MWRVLAPHGVDDSGALAARKANRRELIDPKIAEHDGRIVKTTGEGLADSSRSMARSTRAGDLSRELRCCERGIWVLAAS